MTNMEHLDPFKANPRSNIVEYSTASGKLCTTHDLKVLFFMKKVSIQKIVTNFLRLNDYKENTRIYYDILA